MRIRLVALVVAASLWCALAWAASQPVLQKVQVRGNLRVEEGLILARVSSKAGQPYDPARVREDVRAIYGLGYFEDIVVELDDKGVLTFVVLERPALRDWTAEGAEHVDPEDVAGAVTLKRREIVDDAQLDRSAQGIRQLYREKGYYLAEVKPEIVPVDDGKNQVDVVFRITEGDPVRLKRLHLAGVEQVDEADLRKYLVSSEAGPLAWLTGSGKFKESDLARDREVIQAYYLNHGFADSDVLDPLVSLTSDRRGLMVDIPVREGPVYHFDRITFSGDLEFPEEKLRAAAGIEPGDLFRSEALHNARQKISDLYADQGYAFAEVVPKPKIDRDERTISLDFAIHKGVKVYIGRVEMRGNTKTRDRVLRRDVLLAEGDLYSITAINKSRRRLQNLGFFESVNLTTHRRPGTNLVDVDVEVEEKATGSFSAGAGYSSVDKVIAMLSVSQRNFLGYGYQLSLQANFGSTRTTYAFTFNNPRVFDSDVYAGFDLYNTQVSYTSYDKKAVGTALKLGRSYGDEWRIRGIYRWEDATIKNVDEFASPITKAQEGRRVISSITSLLIYDSRDNPWEAHSGAKADASIEWADHYLGGDTAYIKYDLDATKYYPLWWEHVISFHGRIGFLQPLRGDPIPIDERYTLGGINSVRGFDSRSIGPADPETGDVIGGDKQLLFNAEYLFPLIKEAKVRGVVFFDAGNAWDTGQRYLSTGLRTSAGAGVRWMSPMGPLRLEWGYNLEPRDGEAQSQWEFTVGGFF